MLGAFWAEFEGPRIEIEEALPAGGAVVVGVRFYGRGKRKRRRDRRPRLARVALREGKAVRWQLFRTKQEALDAAGLSK